MVTISRPWYNGSYTMAAKPIKSLELHYTMLQFLIIGNVSSNLSATANSKTFRLSETTHRQHITVRNALEILLQGWRNYRTVEPTCTFRNDSDNAETYFSSAA